MNTFLTEIWWHYKQGDDFRTDRVRTATGETDLVQSLLKAKKRYELIVQEIAKTIEILQKHPDAKMDYHADTHMIELFGDARVIKELWDNKVVAIRELDYVEVS